MPASSENKLSENLKLSQKMASSSEATGVLEMVEESSLHNIIKLNEQNLVKTIKKLEYFNRETDEILATDDLENVTEHYGLM